MIADRAYDSDPLRRRLQKRGIELIAPYRKNNKERRYEDGRKLRRYKRRWIVERTNAWLGQFRRLLVRHEHLLSTYRTGFYLRQVSKGEKLTPSLCRKALSRWPRVGFRTAFTLLSPG